jgi:hypothetical protein
MIATLAFSAHRLDRLAGTLALPYVPLIQLYFAAFCFLIPSKPWKIPEKEGKPYRLEPIQRDRLRLRLSPSIDGNLEARQQNNPVL